MIGTIILSLLLAYVVRYYFVSRRRDGLPSGPIFRIPIIGHAFYLFRDQIEGIKSLKKKYGNIFTVLAGPSVMTYVTEYNLCHEMLSREEFSGRGRYNKVSKKNYALSDIKGGHGHHGLVASSGDEWKEQRRFTLRHLKEFGFGKTSMNDMITEEWDELAKILHRAQEQGEEIETRMLFNLSALNILWRIVAGKRFDLDDESQASRLRDLSAIFSKFGVNSMAKIIGFMLPNWLGSINVFKKDVKRLYHNMFKLFEDEYKEHEQSYDPNYMRDFIDVYMTERIRVNNAKEVTSSFYGETGHWSYVNTMLDLFFAGSETTSTTMVYFILYLLHHPSIQKELQDEIDSVVGRERQPTLDDRDSMPKVMAFISEVHRRAAVAPFSSKHATTEPVEHNGYKYPENHNIIPALALIMNDPDKFPNPERFDPNRFIDQDTGKYKSSPYMCQYGIGKRECLGKSLAKNEQFIFLTNLLHSFTVEPSSTERLPGVEEATISITRVPVPFKARFTHRRN